MRTERIGLVTFFGILVPGAYTCAVFIVLFADILELFDFREESLNKFEYLYNQIYSNIIRDKLLYVTVFIFVSYLIGIIIRLFATDKIEKISWRFQRPLGKKLNKKIIKDMKKEPFPYEKSCRYILTETGMEKIWNFISYYGIT